MSPEAQLTKITPSDDALYTSVIEKAAGGRGGDSVMALFKEKLFMVLDRIEKDAKITVKQVKAGAVANALKDLFVNVDENNRYGRSYRYLKQMGQNLKNRGWELQTVNGTKMIVKVAPVAAETKIPKTEKAATA